MAKTISINGYTFELTVPRSHYEPVRGLFGSDDDIYEYYDRPSELKVAIWHDWIRWARCTDGVEVFHISGASCMTFSISGLYVDKSGVYNLWITKYHNRAIKIA